MHLYLEFLFRRTQVAVAPYTPAAMSNTARVFRGGHWSRLPLLVEYSLSYMHLNLVFLLCHTNKDAMSCVPVSRGNTGGG